ncbi:transposase [Sciscionella marina]|uniref:transposase n=1 Tax=Sciscionella marina TaxID=508770 RepID=UPI000378CA8D|nr:transposase [Sciscionella marina]
MLDAVQVADRWHLWHNLAEAVIKEVAAHSSCWDKTGPPPREGIQAQTTRQRWRQVHDLLDAGVGLLECAHRLNPAPNTVKRHTRISAPERPTRAPKYRPTLADPYREHLRHHRELDPTVPVQTLFAKITQLDYPGNQNLLYRSITQGRIASDRPAISPRHLDRYLLTGPDRPKDHQHERLDAAVTACPETTALPGLAGDFATPLTPTTGNELRLTGWIDQARSEDLPHPHAITHGLELDRDAVNTTPTYPFHNRRTESVNTKTKTTKRQTHGHATSPLLHHRIHLD